MTLEERKKMFAALSAPFPEEAVERTEARTTGRGYNTTGIKAQYILDRLNSVLGVGGWRAHREITVKEITSGSGRKMYEAIADVILELGEWVDGQFQTFAEALADGGHISMSEADARKGSFSNALKKAAAAFGAGGEAYRGTIDDDNTPATDGIVHAPAPAPQKPVQAPTQPVAQQAVAAPAAPATQPQPANPPAGATRNRLTSKQLGAVWALSRKVGLDQHGVRTMVKGRFGCQPEFMAKQQASELIGELSAKAGNGHAPQAEDELRQAQGA